MKIKTNSRLYNIFILYKTLLEYFSTTVYLLSVISVILLRCMVSGLWFMEEVHTHKAFSKILGSFTAIRVQENKLRMF